MRRYTKCPAAGNSHNREKPGLQSAQLPTHRPHSYVSFHPAMPLTPFLLPARSQTVPVPGGPALALAGPTRRAKPDGSPAQTTKQLRYCGLITRRVIEEGSGTHDRRGGARLDGTARGGAGRGGAGRGTGAGSHRPTRAPRAPMTRNEETHRAQIGRARGWSRATGGGVQE